MWNIHSSELCSDTKNGRSNNRTVFAPALARTLAEVRQNTGGIVIVGPTPGGQADIPFHVALSIWKDSAPPKGKDLSKVRQRDQWFWQEANNYKMDRRIALVDPASWFCTSGECRYEASQGELLYRDGGHLSVAGAKYVATQFPDHLFQKHN